MCLTAICLGESSTPEGEGFKIFQRLGPEGYLPAMNFTHRPEGRYYKEDRWYEAPPGKTLMTDLCHFHSALAESECPAEMGLGLEYPRGFHVYLDRPTHSLDSYGVIRRVRWRHMLALGLGDGHYDPTASIVVAKFIRILPEPTKERADAVTASG